MVTGRGAVVGVVVVAALAVVAGGCEVPWMPRELPYLVRTDFTPPAPPHTPGREVLPTWDDGGIGDHDEAIARVVFSPDGSLLATTGRSRPTLVWSVQGRRLVLSLPHDDRVHDLAFSLGGHRLLAAGDDGIWGWDLASGASRVLVAQRRLGALCFTLSAGGEEAAAGTSSGDLFVWDTQTWARRFERRRAHQPQTNGVALDPTGRWLASAGGDGQVRLVRRDGSGELTIPTQADQARAVAFSHDGSLLAIGRGGNGGGLIVWDVAAAKVRWRERDERGGSVEALAWSPDDAALAVGSGDQTSVWSPNGSKQALDKHERDVTTVAWSPAGDLVASGDNGGRVHVSELGRRDR